jgi:hypothetical protein
VRLVAAQTEEPSRELGDLIEPGSSVEVSAMPQGSAGGAASLEQLKELRASGLIDTDTFDLIEATMASMPATTADANPSVDAAELDLLQHGESAPATVLTPPSPTAANGRLLMTLEVHPAAGSPYEVDCSIAAIHPSAELKAGDFLQVKVDPDDPKRVAIDWTALGI